jgi:hypothetical protein
MSHNPFKYNQALDPVKDKLVCLPRAEEVNQVITGIIQGDYWAILGPARIGKTTFLRLIKENFPHAYYLYFDFKTPHSSESDFYLWLMKTFEKEIPSIPSKRKTRNQGDFSPSLGFIQFLEDFKPKVQTQKIVLLVDNVEGSPYVDGFLKLWRKVYQKKDQSEALDRYSIITTGSKDLISLSLSPTSPFNVADILFLKDFTNSQSEQLIDEPLHKLNIKIDQKEKNRLLSEINGHPQLLQHACYLLVERATGKNKSLTVQDITEVINILLKENSVLLKLREELEENNDLRKLVKDVLNGDEKKFLPYKGFSLSGAGAVTESDDYCVIRNELYRKVIIKECHVSMIKNPYKFKGPLSPGKDKLVLVPRSRDLERVCAGIEEGKYWVVLGSRQTGCTTFLRQIKNKIKNAHHLYIDFQHCSTDEKDFYQCLVEEFIKGIPSELDKCTPEKWKDIDSASKFLKFLEKFKPQKNIDKILLLFDEVEDIPALHVFLHIWEETYNSEIDALKKYVVVIADSNELESLTVKKTSFFNIAYKLYMRDFSPEESRQLIEKPFVQLNIKIDSTAIEKLLSRVNGHPQLQQHLCSLLVDRANRESRRIMEKDIDEALKTLLKKSNLIDTLKEDITGNRSLKDLIQEIFEGKKKPFHLNKEYSIKGAGCIVEDNTGNCAIRNKIYEEFLRNFFHIPCDTFEDNKGIEQNPGSLSAEEKPIVFICYSKKDKKWKDMLSKYLSVLEHQNIIRIWDDQIIKAGDNWRQQIEKTINAADAAIFLVSENSLSSKFIVQTEIPLLLERKEMDEIPIIPVLLKICPWKNVDWLESMQLYPKDAIPLDSMRSKKQEKIFSEIADYIANFFKSNRKKNDENPEVS